MPNQVAFRQLSDVIVRGMHWWIAELRDIARIPFERSRLDADRLIIALAGAHAQLLTVKGRTVVPLADGRMMTHEEVVRLAVTLAGARAVVVRLPQTQCYLRQVQLPAAARAEFSRMLALQLGQLTPFKSGDVYQAHVVSGDAKQGLASVTHVVAKRSQIDPILDLCRRGGLPVDRVDCWPAAGAPPLPVNFLAETKTAVPRHGLRALLALALVLLAGAAVMDGMKRQLALSALQGDVARLRDKVRSAQAVVAARASSEMETSRVLAIRAGRPAAIELLEEMTRTLPDATVLHSMRLDGTVVEISGLTDSAAALLPLLEASRLFSDARLSAPVRVEDGERERFSLRLQARAADDPGLATGGPKR